MPDTLVFVAGLTQLGIALSSLLLPRMLGWREQILRLEPLTRQVFWTYACYILGTNLFFAGVSLLAPSLLTDGTPLARLLCAFITVYWGARVGIQLFASGGTRPSGWFYWLGDKAYLIAFVFCTAVYGGVALKLW
jgi:hypothetical protein